MLAVGKEAVEAEVCIYGSDPALVDFSRAVSSVGARFTLDVPFTTDFPDKIL